MVTVVTLSCKLMPLVLINPKQSQLRCLQEIMMKNNNKVKVSVHLIFAFFSTELVALHVLEKTLWCSFHPHICDLIVAPHVWMTTLQPQTRTSSPRVFGVRVSALWVCPARGAEGCAREQMVVTEREGSRAQRQGAQRECSWTCGLGWVRTSEVLMQGFFFFTGTNSTGVEGKVAPTAQCWGKMEGSQLLRCCSSASLKSIPNMLPLHGYISVMAVRLLLENCRETSFLLTVFWKFHGCISLNIARTIYWWLTF